MKLIFLLTTLLFPCICNTVIEITSQNESTKTPLYIQHIVSSNVTDILPLDVIQEDLNFIKQFNLTVVIEPKIPSRKQRDALLDNGYYFAIFILDKNKKVDIYIHDLISNKTLLGKRIPKKNNHRRIAHNISDLIIEHLTGSPGFFSTYIAYTKEQKTHKNSYISTKQICIAEYNGHNETVIVEKPDLIFGLRWDPKTPRIFYSQHTKTNIQLRMVDPETKKVHLVSDEDGITMLPTFMPENKGIIVSATGPNGLSQLYRYSTQGVTQITSYEGNSTAPSFSPSNNTLYFCSDFKNNYPHIFAWDMNEPIEKAEQITLDGYCTSPIINSKGTVLAYTKLIKGYMQIFLYDTQTKNHRQITFDSVNKDSCAWSPCNTYLLYGSSKENIYQIVLLNIITGEKQPITSGQKKCSSVAWGPAYKDFNPILS